MADGEGVNPMRVKQMEEGTGDDVQMAPLIDCVFLLLIFFLVGATLKKSHREMELELPVSAAATKTKSETDTLIIEVARDGTVYLESEPLSKHLLLKRVREAAREAPNRRVRVDADRAAAFMHVCHLLDLLQFEGLNNVGVRTRD
jgi:biopolymer transport protein ExbD